MNKENQLLLQIGSALSDAAVVVLSMLLAYCFRFWIFHGQESMPLIFYVRSALLIALLFLLLFTTLGMYENRRNVLLLPMIQQIIAVSFVCTAVLATVYFTSRSIHVSRILLLLFFVFTSVLLSLKRALVQRAVLLHEGQGFFVRREGRLVGVAEGILVREAAVVLRPLLRRHPVCLPSRTL